MCIRDSVGRALERALSVAERALRRPHRNGDGRRLRADRNRLGTVRTGLGRVRRPAQPLHRDLAPVGGVDDLGEEARQRRRPHPVPPPGGRQQQIGTGTGERDVREAPLLVEVVLGVRGLERADPSGDVRQVRCARQLEVGQVVPCLLYTSDAADE